jgi:hypothetical protein
MPDRDVYTIYDVMNFQYAKIITCSAFQCANGGEAKKKYYGFIKNTFRDLSSWKTGSLWDPIRNLVISFDPEFPVTLSLISSRVLKSKPENDVQCLDSKVSPC